MPPCASGTAPDGALSSATGSSPIVSDSAETHLDLRRYPGSCATPRIRLVQTVNDNDSMVDAYARHCGRTRRGAVAGSSAVLRRVRGRRHPRQSPLRSALGRSSMAALSARRGCSTGDQGSSVCQIADPQGLGLAPWDDLLPSIVPVHDCGRRHPTGAQCRQHPSRRGRNDQPYGVPGAGTGGAMAVRAALVPVGSHRPLARTVPDLRPGSHPAGWPVVYGGASSA